jgi:hypothetical protein
MKLMQLVVCSEHKEIIMPDFEGDDINGLYVHEKPTVKLFY